MQSSSGSSITSGSSKGIGIFPDISDPSSLKIARTPPPFEHEKSLDEEKKRGREQDDEPHACGDNKVPILRHLYVPSSDVESTQTLEEAPAEPFPTIEISASTSQTLTTFKVRRPRKEVDETNIVATVRSRAPTSRKREAEEQISEGRHKKSSMRKKERRKLARTPDHRDQSVGSRTMKAYPLLRR
ncbi:hypothetical protein B0H13DRAFT_1883287 [Mycena leptocephala]|nr:hypothetical protein B0H13DRAFT_1883287 [Mycena leptocephala]